MKNRLKIAAAVCTAVFALSGTAAFAQSSETATPTQSPAEIVLEDNQNLTPNGNAQLLDDVTDNEDLQFITVTAKDGNVFYIVIDRGSTSENVYFLNTVDESDLAAIVEDYTPPAESEPKPETSPSPEPEQVTEQQPKQEEKKQGNNTMLYILLALVAAAGIGGYYFKVILPKKKLEQADDIEDFEFEETEEVLDEDDETEDEKI